MDLVRVLHHVRPGAEWVLTADGLDGLVWLDGSPAPTAAELEAAWPQVAYEDELGRVRAERQARYQRETDPMFMKVQRDEEDGVTLADWKAAVAAIKADLPYPQAP